MEQCSLFTPPILVRLLVAVTHSLWQKEVYWFVCSVLLELWLQAWLDPGAQICTQIFFVSFHLLALEVSVGLTSVADVCFWWGSWLPGGPVSHSQVTFVTVGGDLILFQNICIPGKSLAQFRSHALPMNHNHCVQERGSFIR